ncbi:hypothetical protein [Microbulbifer donghaiensis]|uniref:hypothetical protein n=1 Tax=Microbulbifer donghaiensis TaxID=494016 RepID=UPI00116126CA|nr:hypothetical protein [Microbulbifer donghaiensis]
MSHCISAVVMVSSLPGLAPPSFLPLGVILLFAAHNRANSGVLGKGDIYTGDSVLTTDVKWFTKNNNDEAQVLRSDEFSHHL